MFRKWLTTTVQQNDKFVASVSGIFKLVPMTYQSQFFLYTHAIFYTEVYYLSLFSFSHLVIAHLILGIFFLEKLLLTSMCGL